jgi:hypothetical protein
MQSHARLTIAEHIIAAADHARGFFLHALTLLSERAPQAPTLPTNAGAREHDLTKREVARAVSVSTTTLDRAGVEPDYFAGLTPRYSIASVREQLGRRGKVATKVAAPKKSANDVDIDVTDELAAVGIKSGGAP